MPVRGSGLGPSIAHSQPIPGKGWVAGLPAMVTVADCGNSYRSATRIYLDGDFIPRVLVTSFHSPVVLFSLPHPSCSSPLPHFVAVLGSRCILLSIMDVSTMDDNGRMNILIIDDSFGVCL